jgi:hypothetical protein
MNKKGKDIMPVNVNAPNTGAPNIIKKNLKSTTGHKGTDVAQSNKNR